MIRQNQNQLDHSFTDPKQLNEIGFIQDTGYLLAVRYNCSSELVIISLSENISHSELFNKKCLTEILDRKIEEFFEEQLSNVLHNLIKKVNQSISIENNSIFPSRNYTLLHIPNQHKNSIKTCICCSAVITSDPNIYIIELEEVTEQIQKKIFPNTEILLSGDMVERFRICRSTQEIVSEFCDSCLDMIPGYDRGMVYQFDEDGTGVVIHENIRDPASLLSTYLHLRFPAGDIPPQARALFIKGGLRFINDVLSPSVPLVSNHPFRLDQSMGRLRAVSPCHVFYLKGMGVRATLSIPIVINGILWGLYVFHSYTQPVKPAIEKRIMLEMAASISAMSIDALRREGFVFRKLQLTSVMSKMTGFKSFRDFFSTHSKQVLSLLNAHCLMAFMDSEFQNGFIFGDQSICLNETGFCSLTNQCKLNEILPMTSFTEGLKGQGAGVVFFKHSNFSLAFIRRCEVVDVVWGRRADPQVNTLNHTINADPDDKNFLSPENSFEKYVEKARVTSKAWSNDDIEAISYFIKRTTEYQEEEMLASFRVSLEQANSACAHVMEVANDSNDFFAHMSHELRTPFHGVFSALQILKKVENQEVPDLPLPERREILLSALECGQNMLRTLNDILTIAKNNHSTDVSFSEVSLLHLLQTVERMMSPIAENKQVSFSVEADEENVDIQGQKWASLIVMTDDVRVLQVVNNVTSNAIKFTNTRGSVSVRGHLLSYSKAIQLWEERRGAYEASLIKIDNIFNKEYKESTRNKFLFVFEVQDSGKGVTQNEAEMMFDAYKQVSRGVMKAYQGTGLGLQICNIHCQDLEGSLAVASTPGVGTLFMGFIPVDVLPENECSVDASALKFKSMSSTFHCKSTDSSTLQVMSFDTIEIVGRKKKITPFFLLVDDSMVNLRLTKRKLLMTLGDDSSIILATDGLEAIEKVKEMMNEDSYQRLHGILMDYHMPKCSGVEAIKAIRELEVKNGKKGVHIIGFTGDITKDGITEMRKAGANETLPKPTPMGQLEGICLALVRKSESV